MQKVWLSLAHTKVRPCHPKPCLRGRAVSNHPSRDHPAFYQGSVDQQRVGMKQNQTNVLLDWSGFTCVTFQLLSQPLCGTVLGGCSCTTTTRHVSQQLVNESSCFEYFTRPSGYKSQTFTCSLLEIKVTRWHSLPLTALCFFLRAFCFQLSLDKGSGAEPQDSEVQLKQSEEPSVALSCSAAARADNYPCSGLAPSRGLSSLTLNGLSGRDSAPILSHTASASASEHPFWLHPQF